MEGYTRLKTSVDSNKDKKLNEMFDTMEKGLMYVGSSAIEDKLQVGVADTISRIMKASIRVWVLTGDKQETAIEIGKSCKLIQKHMKEYILSSKDREEFRAKLSKFTQETGSHNGDLAIVIDGQTLIYAMEDDIIAD